MSNRKAVTAAYQPPWISIVEAEGIVARRTGVDQFSARMEIKQSLEHAALANQCLIGQSNDLASVPQSAWRFAEINPDGTALFMSGIGAASLATARWIEVSRADVDRLWPGVGAHTAPAAQPKRRSQRDVQEIIEALIAGGPMRESDQRNAITKKFGSVTDKEWRTIRQQLPMNAKLKRGQKAAASL